MMSNQSESNQFPKDFILGVGTSAYQTEGAWDEDGKGENMWDRMVHTYPDVIFNRENGDVACSSYHKYKEDIELIKDIGFQMYRFSLSWTRILPKGDMSVINQKGIDHYHRVIDELLDNGIQPMVTLYHWDLPQTLQEFGGWLNPIMVDYFADYARLVFGLYGDKVKWWNTINEPKEIVCGYSIGRFAPFLNLEAFGGDYLAGHVILKAHAKAYHIYDKEFRSRQKGKVSLTISGQFHEPKDNTSKEDQEAAERANQFEFGWFAHPIYSEDGDYPPIMRELVDLRSREEGRPRSRLPVFTRAEIEEIRGTFDFLGTNFYSAFLSTSGTDPRARMPMQDANCIIKGDTTMKQSPTLPWLRIIPRSIRGYLLWLKKEYNNPAVFITENGYSDAGEVNDVDRMIYFENYIREMLHAMHDHGCNIIGYVAWSLLDNFEWGHGYKSRMGIIHVDFQDPERKRTFKQSANLFREMLSTRSLPQLE